MAVKNWASLVRQGISIFDGLQLKEWQDQALSSLEATSKPSPSHEEYEKLQKDFKQLEREILRKDKALAEASALLILQKKIALIWGNEDPK